MVDQNTASNDSNTDLTPTEPTGTELTVSQPVELALSEPTTLALTGASALSGLHYQVYDRFFFLTSSPLELDDNAKPIANEDEKISFADLAASLGVHLEAEARKRATNKLLSHGQWLTFFRADEDDLPEEMKEAAKLRFIGRFDSFLQAVKVLKFDSQPKASNDELERISKFFRDTSERASAGISQQPKFSY